MQLDVNILQEIENYAPVPRIFYSNYLLINSLRKLTFSIMFHNDNLPKLEQMKQKLNLEQIFEFLYHLYQLVYVSLYKAFYAIYIQSLRNRNNLLNQVNEFKNLYNQNIEIMLISNPGGIYKFNDNDFIILKGFGYCILLVPNYINTRSQISCYVNNDTINNQIVYILEILNSKKQ